MNYLRKLVGLLTVMLLLGVALPARADRDDENFSLKVVATATPGTFTATITNTTRDDDDKIKSFKITVPASPSGVAITGVTAVGGTGTTTGYTRDPATFPTGGSSYVTVKGVSIKYNQNIVVTFTATLPSSASCGVASYKWGAVAWDGSNASGDQFQLTSSDADRTTTVSNTCTMSFVSLRQPQNALVGTYITSVAYNPTGAGVQVQLLVNGAAPNPPVSVTLANATGTCLASSPTAAVATDASGAATFSGLTSKSTAGTGCTLKATATGYPGATSTAFAVNVPSLKFEGQPTDALTGTPVTTKAYNTPVAGGPVTVRLYLDSTAVTGNTFDGIPVTLSSSTCSGLAYGVNPASVLNGLATFAGIQSAAVASNCTLGASGFGTASTSSAFNVTAPEATLFCKNQNLPPSASNTFTDSTGTVTGYRGQYNKEGSTCVPVTYQVTRLAAGGDKTVNLSWNTGAQPNAAFSYTILWNPTAVSPATGMPTTRRTKVAWETGLYGVTGPVYVYGVACLTPSLPAPYGTLASFTILDSTHATITINVTSGGATLPATAPPSFPLVIGTERLLATSGSGTTFTVTRGDGGTTPVNLANYIGINVMSTPMPIDPNTTLPPTTTSTQGTANPYFNKQAHMCIWDEGFFSSSTDPGKVRFNTSVFDIGDGNVTYDE